MLVVAGSLRVRSRSSRLSVWQGKRHGYGHCLAFAFMRYQDRGHTTESRVRGTVGIAVIWDLLVEHQA